MRKSTIFISSVLTTFALVILYGVVRSYQNTETNQMVEKSVQSTISTPVPADTAVPAATIITPEEAAQLAAQVVGHNDLYSAEISNFNGVDAYLITFTNKDVVYVSLDGQILSVQIAPVIVNVVPAPKKNNRDDQQTVSQQTTNQQTGEDDHEDHEEHDD